MTTEPGPALPFEEWCRVLVDCLRTLLPDVNATPSRRGVTIWRPGSEHVVTIAKDGGGYWVASGEDAPMARLVDSDRHDAHTARAFARSIAGGFDARLASTDDPH
jgi:hypothetical protein